MAERDVWDESASSRRAAKRFRTRWKAALVFERSTGRPIFHALTYDLSATGTSVQSDTTESVGTTLMVLLRPPPLPDVPQGVIKLQAKVVSAMGFRGSFRLGIAFADDGEAAKLRQVLGMLDNSTESLPSDPEADRLPTLLLDDDA